MDYLGGDALDGLLSDRESSESSGADSKLLLADLIYPVGVLCLNLLRLSSGVGGVSLF